MDCIRNSKEKFARTQLGHKAIHGLSCTQMCAKVIQEKGLDWRDLDPCLKWGTFVKRVLVQGQGYNQKTKAMEDCTRTKMERRSFPIEILDKLIPPGWNSDPNAAKIDSAWIQERYAK